MAGEDELAGVIVVAEQQRAEGTGAPAAALGVAGDDELCFLGAFDLEPALGPAARFVKAGAFLRDEAFQAVGDGGLEGDLAGLLEVIDEEDALAGDKELLQQAFAKLQRRRRADRSRPPRAGRRRRRGRGPAPPPA